MEINRNILTVLAAFASALAWAADPYDVHNEIELTNALVKATANNAVIRIYPGTYDLHGITMATETLNKETHGIHLKLSAYSGKLLGMGATPADTVIKGGGAVDKCRLMTFAKNYYVISNLTFTGGYVDTKDGSGGVCMGRNQTFVDCRFVGNYAGNFAGAIDQPTSVIRCHFEGNESANDGGVYRGANGIGTFSDCTFVNNHSAKGGIGYGSAIFKRCTFVGNYSVSTGGIVNHVDAAGAASTSFSDCTFSNNYVSSSYAIFDYAGGVTNCTFVGNRAGVWGTHTGDYVLGRCGSVIGCHFLCNTGMPMVTECTFRSCTFKGNVGHRINGNAVFNNSNFYNCLFERNRGGISNSGPLINGSSLYNCTVVSNKYQGASYTSLQYGGVAVNTVFDGNYLFSTKDWNPVETYIGRRDVYGQYAPPMTNCLWTAQTGTIPAGVQVGGGLVTTEQLRFTNAAKGDYSIQRKSVARNAGWSDAVYLSALGPVDLAGNPRVYDGDAAAVDVGAYECCLRAPGLMLLVR